MSVYISNKEIDQIEDIEELKQEIKDMRERISVLEKRCFGELE